MTDEEFDRRAREAGRRVQQQADELAASDSTDAASRRSSRSGWLAAAAVLIVVVGMGALLVVAMGGDGQAPADTARSGRVDGASPPTSIADIDTTLATGSTPLEATTTTGLSPTGSAADTPPATEALPVPQDLPLLAYVEGECASQAIRWDQSEETFAWSPFARGISDGAPVQVIADPATGAAGPYAVVIRDFAPTRPGAGNEVEINGQQVFVDVYDTTDGTGGIGNGEAEWNLADGSQGYLRARGLDQASIESIVAGMQPRPIDHPVPGFDYDNTSTQPQGLELVAEATTDAIAVASYTIECINQQAPMALDQQAVVVADDGVAPYVLAIDRPRPAWIVRRDGAVLIGGFETRAAHGNPDPPADALVAVSPAQWLQPWSSDNPQPTTADPAVPAEPTVDYVVQAGDYPLKVADQYCMSVDELAELNEWNSLNEFPFPGRVITVYERTCGARANATVIDNADTFVIADDESTTLTIDRGNDHGVAVGQPVVTSAGLVGIIVQVTDNSSLVITMTDPRFTTPIAVQKASADDPAVRCTARGATSHVAVTCDDPTNLAEPIAPTATTASGGRYPVGIPLGRITFIDDDGNRSAHIEPWAQPRPGDTVTVLLETP